jgi:deazaflavin-dependent oxidoreductase (nitroreductase family)
MSDASRRDEFLSKLRRSGEVRITVTGRKTKKKISTPVWFVLDEERKKVLIVPVYGSSTNWLKNLEKDPSIGLSVDRTTITSKANLVKDENQTKKIVERLKQKYKSEWSDSYYTTRDAFVEIPV